MPNPYTADLVDSEIPTSLLIQAQSRFCSELERRLGSPDDVATIYRAWIEATESESGMLTRETAELAVKWPRAFEAARSAGMHDLGEYPDARFDVQLAKQLA